jgi:cell division protein FtsA
VLGAPYPKRKIDDIIARRVSDMFKLVESHLKKIGKDELLPAGVILTGGGSSIQTAADLAKAVLRLPSRTAPFADGAQKMQLRDSSWSVHTVFYLGIRRRKWRPARQQFGDFFKNLWRWFKKFLP